MQWRESASRPRPGADEIHVWRARLDLSAERVAQLEPTLSEDEHTRARRYLADVHRVRFIARRAILRTILARYTNLRAADVRFSYGTHGKPLLANRTEPGNDLFFNCSHSEDVALFAVTRRGELGIDVERVAPIQDLGRLAARFFSHHEAALINGLEGGRRERAFFRCWTYKEAFVKAIGSGLGYPLDSFDVSVLPEEVPPRLRLHDAPPGGKRWNLQPIPMDESFFAAVAWEGADAGFRLWDFDSEP